MSDITIKKEKGEKKPVVINQLNIISVDRSSKDITDWRNAHRNAEATEYPNRSRLYDIYKDVELDGHLSGIVQKRIDAVLNKKISFVSADAPKQPGEAKANEAEAERIKTLVESPAFRNLVRLIMEKLLWGVSGAEFVPGPDLKFYPIPRKHIKPKWGIIAKEQSGQEGFKYADVWNLFVIGDNDDLGLYLKCTPYALWKKGGFADWAQYVELFGQPVRIAKYDAFDIKTKEELTKTLNDAGSSLAMMIPKQAEFEMMDGKTSNGTGELQERFKNACNQEMSIIILGNTETTNASRSSGYAQAKEHSKQQLEITRSDIAYVEGVLNDAKLIAILQTYGYQVGNGRFVIESEADPAELSTRKDIDLAISNKVPVADDYWYDTYSIPKPNNYDELKAQMDAERMIKLMPQEQPGSSTSVRPGKNVKSNLSAWRNIRQTMADFFDPAP